MIRKSVINTNSDTTYFFELNGIFYNHQKKLNHENAFLSAVFCIKI